LSRVSFRVQPCLRDIWHDHVLLTEDEVTGLIDPSACRAENIATDLARLLGSLLNDDREAWEFALREYESDRPMDSHERALVDALDQSGVLLSGMAWMDRLFLSRDNVPPLSKVWERLETIRRRLQFMDGESRRFASPQ
jgi:Ser/Thr protein kinase RdoA (MazF antagonist)